MTDVLTPEQRRLNMSRIRSRNTKPEVAVQRLLKTLGVSFDLHAKELPGKPDAVIRSLRSAIFVHGCYWHKHRCRYGRVRAQTNATFWDEKRAANVARDRRDRRRLRALGWRAITIWECWIRVDIKKVEQRITEFLGEAEGRKLIISHRLR